MKPEDVLALHKSFMNKYDQLVPIIIETKEEKGLEEFIRDNLVIIVDYKQSSDDTESNVFKKMVTASKTTYQNAVLCHGELTKDNYDNFRAAYDDSLRIELYRHFIVINQDINAIKLKFIAEKKIAPTLGTLTIFMLDDVVKKMRSEFSKFKELQNSSSSDHDKGLIISMESELEKLIEDLMENIVKVTAPLKHETPWIQAVQDGSLAFEIAAGQLIRSYQIKTESNASWEPFLKNLLLLVSVIGTIPAIVSMAYKATTGRYAFFDTLSLHKPESLEEMAPEDQLLAIPNTI